MTLPAPAPRSSARWPALAAARSRPGPPRVPLVLPRPFAGERTQCIGSVAVDDLEALAAFPDLVYLAGAGDDRFVVLREMTRERREARMAEVHLALRAAGRIRAWRDELFPLFDRAGVEQARIERAATRFWGVMTQGAHANGYVADASGRPVRLWIARRARDKPTDPGRLDTLIGGGVPAGQTPDEALVREGAEEAGLTPAEMTGRVAGSLLGLCADIPEGRQLERLHIYDLAVPADWTPRAVDGEVEEHLCLPVEEALARAADGEMTTDAALATLDFALRHGCAGPQSDRLALELDALRIDPRWR